MAKRAAAKAVSREIRYRFVESGAEWALTDDGHYQVLRCGDLVPGARVRTRLPGMMPRYGEVVALLPGWGPSPRPVGVWVRLEPQSRPNRPHRQPVHRMFAPHELMALM